MDPDAVSCTCAASLAMRTSAHCLHAQVQLLRLLAIKAKQLHHKIICSARSRPRRLRFFAYIRPHLDQLRSAAHAVVCMDMSCTATFASSGHFLANHLLTKCSR